MRSLLMTVVVSAAVSAMTPRTQALTQNVAPCVCLPYYLYNDNKVAIDGNNSTVTGWGQLDIRITNDGTPISPCQESLELCCTNPRPVPVINLTVVTPKPPSMYRGCGYENPAGLDFSLLGGTDRESLFGQYPWVVMLFYKTNNIGSGVLIHPEVVLTVAHKVDNIPTDSLIVRAGEWDVLTTKERLNHQDRAVRSVVKHNEYIGIPYLFNDIAILRLAQPMDLDSHISVICLPEQDENFDSSTNCISNGWSKDAQDSAGKLAGIQKRVELHMIQHHVCDDIVKGTGNFRNTGFWLHDSFVCAIAENGWDICEGDGGGPLACPFEPNRFKLTGLTSWIAACGNTNIPGAYVAVSKFRTWINSILAGWGLDLTVITSTAATVTEQTTIATAELWRVFGHQPSINSTNPKQRTIKPATAIPTTPTSLTTSDHIRTTIEKIASSVTNDELWAVFGPPPTTDSLSPEVTTSNIDTTITSTAATVTEQTTIAIAELWRVFGHQPSINSTNPKQRTIKPATAIPVTPTSLTTSDHIRTTIEKIASSVTNDELWAVFGPPPTTNSLSPEVTTSNIDTTITSTAATVTEQTTIAIAELWRVFGHQPSINSTNPKQRTIKPATAIPSGGDV